MMSLKDKLIIYIYNKMNAIEDDRQEVRRQMRYRPLDSLDMYEKLRQEITAEVWDEFITDLYNIVFNSSYRNK